MKWDTIPLITDGKTTFSEQDINPIIKGLTDRTDILKEHIINDSVLNGVGFSDIGLSGCEKGQFVAYDKTTKCYIPANAKWNSISEIPEGEACVVGLLITDVVEDRGTILVSGIIRNASLIETITGIVNPPAGEYYLTSEGQVTQDTSKIVFPIHCGSLISTGCFVLNIQIPDFRTHTHTQYNMKVDAWEHIGANDCTWRYDNSKDTLIDSVLRTLISGMVLVVNNKIFLEGLDYTLENGVMSLKHEVYNNDGSVANTINSVLFATNPFAGIVPWITDVQTTDNKIIDAAQTGTTTIIDVNFPIVDNTLNTGKAVTGITREGVYTGDIINTINAGAGIVVSQNKGDVTIASSASLERYVELNIMNGSGIIYGGDNDSCCIKFPAGRISHLAGTVRTPGDSKKFKIKVFAYIDNIGVSPTLSAKTTIMTASESEPITSLAYDLQLKSNNTMGTVLMCTTDTVEVSGNSLITLDLYTNNPSATMSLRSCGVIFTAL